jgi:hypothetical protein
MGVLRFPAANLEFSYNVLGAWELGSSVLAREETINGFLNLCTSYSVPTLNTDVGGLARSSTWRNCPAKNICGMHVVRSEGRQRHLFLCFTRDINEWCSQGTMYAYKAINCCWNYYLSLLCGSTAYSLVCSTKTSSIVLKEMYFQCMWYCRPIGSLSNGSLFEFGSVCEFWAFLQAKEKNVRKSRFSSTGS